MIIILAGSLAWLPLLGTYTPVADDIYHSEKWSSPGALNDWLKTEGIWRIVGIPITVVAIKSHPLFYNVLAVGTHLLTTCLFFRVCWLLLGSIAVSLVLALIVVAFPWGYGAIVFAGTYNYVLATALFWATLLILISYSKDKGCQTLAFLISYSLTLFALLIQESLTFCFMVSGAILWVTAAEFSVFALKKSMVSHFSGLAPTLGSLTYILLYQLFKTEVMWKPLPSFNIESIFSTYYYQWTNIDVFQPWFSTVCRELIFLSWDWGTIAIVVLSGAAFFCSLFVFIKW